MTQGGAACAGCDGGVADDPPAKFQRTRGARARRARAFKKEGGFIRRSATSGYTPSQETRDCLHVAVANLTGIALSEVVGSLPPSSDADTRFSAMDQVLRARGWSLRQVTQEFRQPGGLLLNLMRCRDGLHVGLFRIAHKTDRKYHGSNHCLAFNGRAVIADRGRYPLRELEDTDRESTQACVRVIEDFTPRQKEFWRGGQSLLGWHLTNVYRLEFLK